MITCVQLCRRERKILIMTKPAIALFFKSHIDTYTRGDGTVITAHDDKRKAKPKKAASNVVPMAPITQLADMPEDPGDDDFLAPTEEAAE
mgnify:CR=1 FL=1